MIDALHTAHAAVVAIVDEHAAAVAYAQAEQADGRYTAAGAAEHVNAEATRRNWPTRLDDAEHTVKQTVTAAENRASRARAAAIGTPTGTAAEQLLAESRAVRAWERLGARLSRLSAAATVPLMRAAFAAATGDERRVYAEELPTFAETHDLAVDVADVIDAALAADSDDYADARAALDDTRRQAAAVRRAVSVARSVLDGEPVSAARVDLQLRDALA